MPHGESTLTREQASALSRTRRRLDEEGAKALRESLHFTVLDFSRALHTAPSVVRRWEKLNRTPTTKFVLRIAELIDAIERP